MLFWISLQKEVSPWVFKTVWVWFRFQHIWCLKSDRLGRVHGFSKIKHGN